MEDGALPVHKGNVKKAWYIWHNVAVHITKLKVSLTRSGNVFLQPRQLH